MLTARCSHEFDSRTQQRGWQYLKSGQVEELSRDGYLLEFSVYGSEPEPYVVLVDSRNVDAGQLYVSCDCPRYEDGYLCKHIWAVLGAIDDLELLTQVDGNQPIKVLDYSERLNFQRPNGVAPNSWRQALRASNHHPALDNLQPGSALPGSSNPEAVIWYAWDVGTTFQHGHVQIELFQQQRKSNGEWGEIKPYKGNDRVAHRLTKDRRILGLLDECRHEPSGYSRTRLWFNQREQTNVRSVRIPHDVEIAMLQQLASTGRLVWSMSPHDEAKQLGERVPLTWDGGPPWQFRLLAEPASEDSSSGWQLRGQLERQYERSQPERREARSLDTPVVMTQSGIVLFEDQVARFDPPPDFTWVALLRKQQRLFVPAAEQAEFLQRFWQQREVPPHDFPEELQLAREVGQPRNVLELQLPKHGGISNALSAEIRFDYGVARISPEHDSTTLPDLDNHRLVLRDEEAENAALQKLHEKLNSLSWGRMGQVVHPKYGSDEVGVYVDHNGFTFLPQDLPQLVVALQECGWTFEADGRPLRQSGKLSLSVTSDVDWFELAGEANFEGQEVPLPQILSALKEGRSFITLDDGSHGMLPQEWLDRFGQLSKLGKEQGEGVRFGRSQALLLDALLAEQEVKVDRKFRAFRDRLRKFDGVTPATQPRGLQGQMRDYQKIGLGWLNFLNSLELGGCLADDMGLGKTIQVLSLLENRRLRRVPKGEVRQPSLAVVPKSLVFNWIDEAARFTPRLKVLNYTGLGRKERLAEEPQPDLIVTTYGTLRRDILELRERQFDYVVLDEAQAIKNAQSQSAKACRLLQSQHRLAVTGTPIENHLGELWSLLEFLNPGMLGSSSAFKEVARSGADADENALDQLRRGLAPFILRRTKQHVLKELPEKTEQTIFCEMPRQQRKVYDELRDYYRTSLAQHVARQGIKRSKIHVLEALLRLRQAACHPGLLDMKKQDCPTAKMEVLLQHITELANEGHKALVFSQFTSLLRLVRRELDARQIEYEYLDGRTQKRKERVTRFQEDPRIPLFLISLKAGGHGLNLTAADYVFILDPWWNPAVESQAVDRAHRIGQTQHVFAYRLICRDTVEEKILQLQEKKRSLAEAVISADQSLIQQLTPEDLQLLLS